MWQGLHWWAELWVLWAAQLMSVKTTTAEDRCWRSVLWVTEEQPSAEACCIFTGFLGSSVKPKCPRVRQQSLEEAWQWDSQQIGQWGGQAAVWPAALSQSLLTIRAVL